jgi:glycosyltransferase involved in cell wall biosynthesis
MDRNKKIIIITNGNFPFGDASANFLRNLSYSLTEENNDVLVILPSGEIINSSANNISNQKKNEINGVKFRYLGYRYHPTNYFHKFFSLILSIIVPFLTLSKYIFLNKADIILLYNVSFINIFHYLILKLLSKIKIVIIIPEFYDKFQYKSFSLKRAKWYNFYIGIRYLSKYADGYIVLSHYLKNYLINTVKVNKQIYLLPNLVNPDEFRAPITKEIFIPDCTTIGYVGTPSVKDGICDLIDAFKLVHQNNPNTHLLIIGDIPHGLSILPALKKRVSLLNIDNNVTFTGLVPQSRASALLNSCQILALTRRNTIVSKAGFPTKLGEYFACKKPVILTNVGDFEYYFKDNMHVKFAEQGNIKSIAAAILDLIQNEEKQNVLAENAYNWMMTQLNYKAKATEINSFLDDINQ